MIPRTVRICLCTANDLCSMVAFDFLPLAGAIAFPILRNPFGSTNSKYNDISPQQDSNLAPQGNEHDFIGCWSRGHEWEQNVYTIKIEDVSFPSCATHCAEFPLFLISAGTFLTVA